VFTVVVYNCMLHHHSRWIQRHNKYDLNYTFYSEFPDLPSSVVRKTKVDQASNVCFHLINDLGLLLFDLYSSLS